MKVKIISDGTSKGTRVYDDAGRQIENIISVDWHAEPNEAPIATLKFWADIEAFADLANECSCTVALGGVRNATNCPIHNKPTRHIQTQPSISPEGG